MKLYQPIIVWFCVAAYLFALPLNALGLGLCWGSDGHVTLEAMRSGKCCPSTTVNSGAIADQLSLSKFTVESCGSCVDKSVAHDVKLVENQSQLLEVDLKVFANNFSAFLLSNFKVLEYSKGLALKLDTLFDISSSDLVFQRIVILLV